MKNIDLHGIKHADVPNVLDKFFYEMICKNITEFKVITGFSEKMKSIVVKTSSDYNFKVSPDFNNYGILIISF